jgi:hypothetical protein
MGSRRLWNMLTGSAVVVAMAMVAPLVTDVPAANAAVAPCTSSDLSASVVKMTTLPGGTTIVFALRNNGPRKAACRVSGSLSVQFLSTAGAAVGRSAASPSLPSARLIRPTLQARSSVSTMEGVQCTSRLASAMRISWSKVTKVIRLAKPLGVCINGTTKWTTVARISFP